MLKQDRQRWAREIGERVKAMRGTRSLREYSHDLGISHVQVWKYERGESVPDPDALLAIRELERVSVDWILLGDAVPRKAAEPHYRDEK